MKNLVLKGIAFLAVFLFAIIFLRQNVFAATVDVSITASGIFSPTSVTINTGDTVRWTSQVNFTQVANDTHITHYDYPDPSCQNNSANCWQSPVLFTNDTYSFIFMIAGTWWYHDHLDTNQGTGVAGPAQVIVNDTRAPAAVSNLAASGATQTTISLTWTSPGDDQGNYVNYGTPTTYDIRHSTNVSAANASWWATNWGSATPVSGEPTPSASGTSESMTVSSLTAGTTYYFAMKTSDEVPNESSLSNILTRATVDPADTTAPAAVTDLSLSGATESSFVVSWTSPGDDGNSGTAQSYDLRYSTSPITGSNWSSATQVTGEATPQVAGTKQSMTVSGLTSGTTYYFGLKATDESNNESDLSNVPSMATVTPTSIAKERYGDVTPPAQIRDFIILAVSTSSIEFVWTAPGDDESSGTAAVYDMRYAFENITKGNWPFINQVSGEPAPKIAGSRQTVEISGLAASTTYYLALNAKDERGNESEFSNVVSTTTPAIAAPKAEPPPKEPPKEKAPEEVQKIEEPPKKVPSPPPQKEKITPFEDNDFIRATGDDRIYLISKGAKIWIPTAEAFRDSDYDWTRVREVTAATIESVPALRLVRVAEQPEVYEVDGDKRRHIPTVEAFVNEGHSWDNIVVLPRAHGEAYALAKLLRASGEANVYVIEGAMRRHIPNIEAFRAYGFSWGDVLDVRALVLRSYKEEALVRDISDYKVFLRLWVDDLTALRGSIADDPILAGEVVEAMNDGKIALCLDTRYYGGGTEKIFFQYALEIKREAEIRSRKRTIQEFKTILEGWLDELSDLTILLDRDVPLSREVKSALGEGHFELCLDAK